MEKLNFEELENIFGGVSREEYCKTLIEIVMNNVLDEGAMEGARIGWKKNCA